MPSSDMLSRAPYGPADRLLHHLALGFQPAMEFAFDIERARFGNGVRKGSSKTPIFVCGLARSGTSIITRMLHGSGCFASLTYHDMPFPLAPNTWARLTRRSQRRVEAQERGHGDGLEHCLDSPESIEEVFWRCFEGSRYIRPDGLLPEPPEPETMNRFVDYVELVALRYGHPRYLSKNNNNVLRLPALIQAFPEALLIHPYRDPAQQAASLLEQHERALVLHQADPFRQRYMLWLGHHEFGGDLRPFLLSGHRDAAISSLTIDYWLESWIAVYRHLLDQPPAVRNRQHFIDYDACCRDGSGATATLADVAGLEVGSIRAGFRPSSPHEITSVRPDLLEKALKIHAEIGGRSVG